LERQSRDIAPALAIDDEGDRPQGPVLRAYGQPARRMGSRLDAHLAPEKPAEVRFDGIRREAIGHALALATPVERQHEAGSLVTAPEPAIPSEAEPAVPAARNADALLDDIAARLPDQRTIGEEPDLVGRRRAGNQGADGRVILGVGERGEGQG